MKTLYFTTCSSVKLFDFELVKAGWVLTREFKIQEVVS